jgi:hypothetical protein
MNSCMANGREEKRISAGPAIQWRQSCRGPSAQKTWETRLVDSSHFQHFNTYVFKERKSIRILVIPPSCRTNLRKATPSCGSAESVQ